MDDKNIGIGIGSCCDVSNYLNEMEDFDSVARILIAAGDRAEPVRFSFSRQFSWEEREIITEAVENLGLPNIVIDFDSK